MNETTAAQKEQIAALCQRHRVRRLTWLDKPIREGSEAAFLIEFDPADMPPLSGLAAMEDEIGRVLDCKTDLHPYLRELYLGYGPGESGIAYDRADYRDVPMPRDKIAEFCRRKKIRWLAKLPYPSRGSVTNYADVGFLAEFEPDAKLSWGTFTMGHELGEILGCLADVDTMGWIEPAKLAKILESVEVQYERTH